MYVHSSILVCFCLNISDAAHGRLRRSETGGYERKEKPNRARHSEEQSHPSQSRPVVHRTSRTVHSDREESVASFSGMSLLPRPSPAFSVSPGPQGPRSYTFDTVAASPESLAVQKLQAELEVAEAELKAARLKYQFIQAKEVAEKDARGSRAGTETEFHTLH